MEEERHLWLKYNELFINYIMVYKLIYSTFNTPAGSRYKAYSQSQWPQNDFTCTDDVHVYVL